MMALQQLFLGLSVYRYLEEDDRDESMIPDTLQFTANQAYAFAELLVQTGEEDNAIQLAINMRIPVGVAPPLEKEFITSPSFQTESNLLRRFIIKRIQVIIMDFCLALPLKETKHQSATDRMRLYFYL